MRRKILGKTAARSSPGWHRRSSYFLQRTALLWNSSSHEFTVETGSEFLRGWNGNRVLVFFVFVFSRSQHCSQPGTSHTTQIFSQPGITSRHWQGWRVEREPPALLSSSSNSFNKLLLLLNEQRAIVFLSWWEQSLFPASLVNLELFCCSMESSSKQQCGLSCMRAPRWQQSQSVTATVFDQTSSKGSTESSRTCLGFFVFWFFFFFIVTCRWEKKKPSMLWHCWSANSSFPPLSQLNHAHFQPPL